MKTQSLVSIRRFAGWFALRAPEHLLFGAAATSFAFSLAFSLQGVQPSTSATASFSMATATLAAIISLSLTGLAVIIGYRRYRREIAQPKTLALIVEGKGLRPSDRVPLETAVPLPAGDERLAYVLDVIPRDDGSLNDPEAMIAAVRDLERWKADVSAGEDRSLSPVVYGGLTPVPVTFMTGVLFDDVSQVSVMDWDRDREMWRRLDDSDDKARFTVSGLDQVGDAKEVVVAVSVSFVVKESDIRTTFDVPIVRLDLPDVSSSHWSHEKQIALAHQFLDTVKRLDGTGVERIHLILAAQNSVAFNFGRRYDTRNLPVIVVYQFERSQEKRYPWGIEMSGQGVRSAAVRKTD